MRRKFPTCWRLNKMTDLEVSESTEQAMTLQEKGTGASMLQKRAALVQLPVTGALRLLLHRFAQIHFCPPPHSTEKPTAADPES